MEREEQDLGMFWKEIFKFTSVFQLASLMFHTRGYTFLDCVCFVLTCLFLDIDKAFKMETDGRNFLLVCSSLINP